MSIARDVVILDRADAVLLAAEAERLFDSLRAVERLTHNATDDRARRVYAEIRTALGCGRWVTGGLAEALA